MKTFLLDTFNRYTRFSEKLDVKTTLCNKTWWVFNDSGDKEIYIFQEDGSLIVSVNGQVTPASWKYISTNKSLIISTNKQNVMLQPAFIDKTIFSLRLDGTNDYAFLIDEENMSTVQFRTLSDIKKYIEDKVAIAKLQDKEQVKVEEERRKHLLAVNKENARIEEVRRKEQQDAIEAKRKWQERLYNDKEFLGIEEMGRLVQRKAEMYGTSLYVSLIFSSFFVSTWFLIPELKLNSVIFWAYPTAFIISTLFFVLFTYKYIKYKKKTNEYYQKYFDFLSKF